MDHVSVPSKPCLQFFEFPLLCLPTYQSETWQSYPEEHGYRVTGEISGDFRILKISDEGQRDITESDDEAVAAFLQQWLWLGILSEVFEFVELAAFVRRKPDGKQWLTTSHLQKYSQALIASAPDEPWASSPETVQEWGSHRWQVIRRARKVVTRYLQTYECSADDIVPRTILAVALLCEHLHETLFRVYHCTTVDDPYEAIPKFNWREADADCAMAIIEKLNEGGWCPHTLAGMGMFSSKFETLWFYANLRAPKHDLEHKDCSAEQCIHLQIDHETYRTRHVASDCDCDIVGPDPSALADIVINGKLPLTRVVLTAEGTVEKIDLQPREVDTKFVAISHVWADGHGNPEGNLLPMCFLRELQRLVDQVASGEHILFWMDTLSIPREPRNVRKLALEKLRDPYDYAAHVLVLDSYLHDQEIEGCPVIELLALINVSSWAQRLWTFQEGRLAKDIWVQFHDGIIRMSVGEEVKLSLASEVVSEVSSDIVAFHSSMNSVTEFWDNSGLGSVSITALREGVRRRSTSVLTDEALCLGSIAGFDMGTILDQPEADRMDAFWRAVRSIPAGLALSKASMKLEAKGLRWAPASLMGDSDNNEWDGPTSMLEEIAELSPEGLVCQLAAFKFPLTVAPAFENSLKALYHIASDENHSIWDFCWGINARPSAGRWLICVFEEPWHQTPTDIPEGAMPAILLEQPTYVLDGSQPTDLLAGENISALFVCYTPSQDGNSQHAQAIRHCSLYFLSHKQCAFLEELDTITHQLMEEHWDGLMDRSADWDEVYEFIKPLVPNYVLPSPCLEIGKQALKVIRGTEDIDDQAVLTNAIAFIAMFCFIGPYRDVNYESERKTWVID